MNLNTHQDITSERHIIIDTPSPAPPATPEPSPAPEKRGSAIKYIAVGGVLLVVGILGWRMRAVSGVRPATTTVEAKTDSYQIVQAAKVQTGDLTQTLAVTGSLKTNLSINLSAKITGRVAHVLVEEGSLVRKGEVLVTFEDDDLRSQVSSAAAAVEAAKVALKQRQVQLPATRADIETSIQDAEANLASARAKYRQTQLKEPAAEQSARSDVETARENVKSAQVKVSQARETVTQTQDEVESSIKQNQASVDSALAALDEVKRGSRAQEIAQAQQSVNVLEAQLANQETTVARNQELVKVGASAQSELDAAITQRDVYKAQLESAKQALSLKQEGNTNEQIRQAEETVRQARATLASAIAKRASVTNAMRDVATAVTALNSAQAAQRTAQANLSNIPVTRQDTQIALEAVRQAQATLAKAKANRADIPVAREDIAAAQANVDQAKETLRQARITLSYARVTSPVDGVVNTKSAAPGQTATAGSTLLNIVAVNSVYFEAQVDEDSVRDVKVGMPVQVSAASVSDKPLTGFVADVIWIADSSSRQFRIRVSLPNAKRGLTPGAFARGQIALKSAANSLLVPDDAIREDNGQKFVLTVAGMGELARTEKHVVRTGLSAKGKTQVLSGLQSGERVVVGNPLLKDGTTIRVSASDTYSL